MLRFPSKIKFGQQVFEVLFLENLTDVEAAKKLDGNILYGKCLIRLEDSNHDYLKRAVLLHEILHGCATFADVDLDENSIERLAQSLGAVLVDNPDFTLLWLEARYDNFG